MINDGLLETVWTVTELSELLDYIVAHLVKVKAHGEWDVLFDLDGALHGTTHVVDEQLQGFRVQLEFGGYVRAEDARLERFYTSANIRLRVDYIS
jgi:hypothetical protein